VEVVGFHFRVRGFLTQVVDKHAVAPNLDTGAVLTERAVNEQQINTSLTVLVHLGCM
jgi:hypothetical protein